jgi:hypothetical protein
VTAAAMVMMIMMMMMNMVVVLGSDEVERRVLGPERSNR